MHTITITAKDITAKNAIDLSYLLDITTLRPKDGVRRTPAEQAKQLRRLADKQPLTYTVEGPKASAKQPAKKGTTAIKMDMRKGKVTKSSKVRDMILEHEATIGKSAVIKKIRNELDFSYTLAYTYYTKNRAILVKLGKLEK